MIHYSRAFRKFSNELKKLIIDLETNTLDKDELKLALSEKRPVHDTRHEKWNYVCKELKDLIDSDISEKSILNSEGDVVSTEMYSNHSFVDIYLGFEDLKIEIPDFNWSYFETVFSKYQHYYYKQIETNHLEILLKSNQSLIERSYRVETAINKLSKQIEKLSFNNTHFKDTTLRSFESLLEIMKEKDLL